VACQSDPVTAMFGGTEKVDARGEGGREGPERDDGLDVGAGFGEEGGRSWCKGGLGRSGDAGREG
jgi:hypothetical protein